MSKNAASEERLGSLHETIYKQYKYLCSNPLDAEGESLLDTKALITVLAGGAKFLNDNNVKAPMYIDEDGDALAEQIASTRKKRKFADVVTLKVAELG
jgi:hypothetical protein